MLSIGKLSAPQANYYLDQAEARVDAAQSVGGGLEDYYVSGSEVRGEWLGAGAAELGLSGAVDGDDLRAVLDGLDPADGASLRSSGVPVRVAGFDLTFSAPKSVSVLFGVGDAAVRGAVREAHERAVREALGYVERTAAYVRRGAGGTELQPAGGLVAAAFRHRTSRAGDPQLHTHVLVANLGRGADGRWSALDGRRVYAHARAASFLYQAVLRGELSQALGVAWSPVKDGIAEVDGVPRTVMRAFSRRRADIEAAMAERGTSGPRAAEAAALASRQPKDRATSGETLKHAWRTRARELGFNEERVRGLTGRAIAGSVGRTELDRIFGALLEAAALTHRRPTFTRRDVIQALCERLPAGARVDAPGLERAAEELLASEQVVPLVRRESDDTAESFRRRDGRRVPVLREDLVYSTADQLIVEQQLVDRVTASRGAGRGVADADAVARATRDRPSLSGEQRAMVERLCREGDGVAVVAGRAGTGKTFALAAAREAWSASGRPVLGAAIARRAARELEYGAGIQSTSVAALLRSAAHEPLPAGCVLVVDEAGMLPTRQLAELLTRVERAEGKLVLVGDHRQLPELEAGGAFLGLVRRGLAIELTENRRQVHAWEREALDQLRDGAAELALAAYDAHDRIKIAATPDDARGDLVRDWWAAGDPDDAVMIAHRRVDVRALNAHARRVMRVAVRLGIEELELPGGAFATGDRVVAKRNDARLDIRNGDRGVVAGVDVERHALEVDFDGRTVALPGQYLLGMTERGDPTLEHGYAITGHVAQGLTVREAFVLAGEGMSGEWAYTAISRGRERNTLYLTRETAAARAEFAPVTPAAARAARSPRRVASHERGQAAGHRHELARGRRAGAGAQHRRRACRSRPGRRATNAPPAQPGDRTMSDSLLSELMTSEQVGRLLHMKRTTIEDYARRGMLPSIKLGRHRRFVRSDVEAALAQLRGDGGSVSSS